MHKKKLFHGGIKPSNILFDEEDCLLMDDFMA
jgi:serine/threonine protein kinase